MAKTEQSSSIPIYVWIAGAVLLAVVAFAVHLLTREQVEVRVGPATFQTLSSTVPTNGKVEPVSEYQAHSPSAGVIKKLYVEVGDHVSVGTQLIDMDSSDARKQLADAESNVASAQNSLGDIRRGGSNEDLSRFSQDVSSAQADQQQAASTLDSVKRLQAKGAASAGEVTSAQTKLDSANLALQNARSKTSGRYSNGDQSTAQARLTDARAAVAAARGALNSVIIKSPIAGTVYSIPVSEYDFVPAGDDLMDVADLSRLQVRAYFDEPNIGKLARGQAVKIVWDAKPGRTWHGHIERAPTTVIAYGSTRNVGECIITVDDATGDLLPNTNVTVTVTESQHFNVLSIPREALHTDGTSNYVYRVQDGRLLRTPVQVGVVNLTSVEIQSGISSKDLVVLGQPIGGKELVNGMEVKAIE